MLKYICTSKVRLRAVLLTNLKRELERSCRLCVKSYLSWRQSPMLEVSSSNCGNISKIVGWWREKDERPAATGLSNFILTCTARQRFQLSGFAGVFILTNNHLQINTYHETKHQVWSSHPDPSTSLGFARFAQDDPPPRHPERSERQRTKSRDLAASFSTLFNQILIFYWCSFE